MSEDTGIESAESASAPESSGNSESAPAVQTQESAPQQDAAAKSQEQPFHEHPRFKELVEQKNQFAQRAEQADKSYKQLQAQVAQLQKQYNQSNQPQKPSYDPLFKELESVNPKFAEFIKENYTKAQQVDILQQELAQVKEFQNSYQQQQALSQFDKLCEDNKVDPNFKEFYKEAVANAANASNAGLDALPNLFKQAHERLGKSLEAFSRAQRESYVAAKTADKKPATQTGGTAASSRPAASPMSVDDVKAKLAAAIRSRSTVQ